MFCLWRQCDSHMLSSNIERWLWFSGFRSHCYHCLWRCVRKTASLEAVYECHLCHTSRWSRSSITTLLLWTFHSTSLSLFFFFWFFSFRFQIFLLTFIFPTDYRIFEHVSSPIFIWLPPLTFSLLSSVFIALI